MTRKFYLAALILAFGIAPMFAQNASDDFKSGKMTFSPKPKTTWELGLHFGNYFIQGDVESTLPSLGFGLHLRKSVNYVFSWRADFFYGTAKGFDGILRRHSSLGGGLFDPTYSPYANLNSGYLVSYKTNSYYGAIQGVLNMGNILFHSESNKWNVYTAFGLGLHGQSVKLDLTDGNGQAYADIANRTGYTPEKASTAAGRKEIRNAAKNIYDGVYETEYVATVQTGIFNLGDDDKVNVMATFSLGVSRKLSRRVNIALEHQVNFIDSDNLDGVVFASAIDRTRSGDFGHYTNLRVNFNIGSFSKRSEPLYWMNPVAPAMEDIAELKRRPVLDLTDTDGDGIIDMLDKEPNSPAGARVDTRGVTLDSDADGVPDHLDKEPFSSPGVKTDKDGVAMVPKYTTEDDVNRIVNGKLEEFKKEDRCGKWFLPTVNFDLDRSKLRPETYTQLHQVAQVMKLCPNTCVAVIGHTDVRASEAYNDRLSYRRASAVVDYLVSNYGIERSRFKLMYSGESSPLIQKSSSDREHFVNRRVEFRVCNPDDKEMDAPAGIK